MFERLLSLRFVSFLFRSHFYLSSFTVYLFFSPRRINFRNVAHAQRGELPRGYLCSSKLFDNFDYSETSAMIFQDEPGDVDTKPSNSRDAELDDEIVGKALSSPMFRKPRHNFDLRRGDFQRITEQTNNDCRFRILTLTHSLHQQHLLVGR